MELFFSDGDCLGKVVDSKMDVGWSRWLCVWFELGVLLEIIILL